MNATPRIGRVVQPTLDKIKARNTKAGRVVSSRHIGSLVVDFHRNLIKGGIFVPSRRPYGAR